MITRTFQYDPLSPYSTSRVPLFMNRGGIYTCCFQGFKMTARVQCCGPQVSSGFLVLFRLCFPFSAVSNSEWDSFSFIHGRAACFLFYLLWSTSLLIVDLLAADCKCWRLFYCFPSEYARVCPSLPECARIRSAAQADRLCLWSDYLSSFPSKLS